MQKTFLHKRLLTIVMSILLMVGPTACLFFLDDCHKAKPYFTIQGLHIYNATFTGQGINPWRGVEENESIQYDSFFMKISFERTFYSKLKSSGGQNLYATTCTESGYLGSQIGIDTIYLVTIQDYNNQYLKNDTLNDIVLTNYWTYNVEDFNNFFPISNYISENQESIARNEFEIKITEPPSDDSNNYSFKLIFVLQNGDEFEETSDYIRLIK